MSLPGPLDPAASQLPYLGQKVRSHSCSFMHGLAMLPRLECSVIGVAHCSLILDSSSPPTSASQENCCGCCCFEKIFGKISSSDALTLMMTGSLSRGALDPEPELELECLCCAQRNTLRWGPVPGHKHIPASGGPSSNTGDDNST
ncbi:hypothetical protein AAY473_006743 [Plecturocebus cupreus]